MKKILLVEDEKSIAQMYAFKLEKHGFDVTCAYDGQEGLVKAEEVKPELILLDLKMPNMSGDEMLEIMRSKDWGKNIRVVILTNISKDEAPSRLRFLSVDRYIVKAHHTPAQIIDIVNELIS